MGKMNESTYEALYVYGKKVFNNEMSAGKAAKVVNQSNPEVALSSALYQLVFKDESWRFLVLEY